MIEMKQIDKLTEIKIAYLPIENFTTSKAKVCEAPKHENQELPAFAVLALISDLYNEPVVQMICFDCWKHFDDDMGNPNWNLLEL